MTALLPTIASLSVFSQTARLIIKLYDNRSHAGTHAVQPSPALTKRRTVLRSGQLFLLLVAIIPSPKLGAGDRPPSDPVIKKLIQPMRAIVDGKPFREAIESVARQAAVNVWLDRQVDPSVMVAPGPIGPTTWAALNSIAATQDCVIFPVANVILIGRPAWVDRTALSVMLLETEPPIGDRRSVTVANVHWTDLTSASEALASAAGQAVKVDPPLPHDLWPSVDWQSIDRRVAITLVLGQFDRRPESTAAINRISTVPADTDGQVESVYRLGALTTVFRREFESADRRGQVRVRNGAVTALGSILAHRKALTIALSSSDAGDQSNQQAVYTIKRMRATAEHALEQLAKLAEVDCRFDTGAREACQQVVSVAGKNLTVRQLIDLVVAEVGVKVVWNGDTIVISRPSPITD